MPNHHQNAQKCCRWRMHPALWFALFLLISACSSIDCPLNNAVYTKYSLAGEVDTLKDTLTVSTTRYNGSDTVVINKLVNATSFSLPISYSADADVFLFALKDTNQVVTIDTVTISKENQAHFESVDCTPSFFHTLSSVRCTHNAIDSIVIQQKSVTYDTTKDHLKIYFKPRN